MAAADKDNKNTNNDNNADKPASSSSSALDNVTLKSSIKLAVNATNDALGHLQQSTETVVKPILSRLTVLEKQLLFGAQRAYQAYQQRRVYGPELVASSTILVGGLTTLRRGKIPGALAAVLAGSATYFNIYSEISLLPWPKPKQED